MRVVAESPWDWFLFEEDGQWWLDVLVDHGAVSFSVTAPLDPAQRSAFERDGAAALGLPAGRMRDAALARTWVHPALPDGWSDRVLAAVGAWRQTHPG